VGEWKVYGGKDLPKKPSLKFPNERLNEWREDESVDSEDDELPCVIGGEGGGSDVLLITQW